jgi:hypothetical protein
MGESAATRRDVLDVLAAEGEMANNYAAPMTLTIAIFETKPASYSLSFAGFLRR